MIARISKIGLLSLALVTSFTLLATETRADVDVVLRVVDQNNLEIPGSVVRVLGQGVPTGESISLPEGTHTFTVWVAIFGTTASQLGRYETAEVTETTAEILFEWITSDVLLRLEDQLGAEISGSMFYLALRYRETGTTVTLPITDESVYPSLMGAYVEGYSLTLWAWPATYALGRYETAEVTATTTEIVFEWITSDVLLRLEDQAGAEIPGSLLYLAGRYRETGTTVTLPITDENVYPSMTGPCIDGYPITLWVGILGTAASQLGRFEVAEVTATTTEIVFEWITSDVLLRLEDQNGAEISGSKFYIGLHYPETGTTVKLPITDESVYPTMTGPYIDGYEITLFVGIYGLAASQLGRYETAEVTETTTEIVLEWIQIECPLEILDADGVPVPNSTVDLPYSFPAYVPGVSIAMPVTDNSVYPDKVGAYANGYPITVIPGDVAPNSGTFDFELLLSGLLEPCPFSIEGNTYCLEFQCITPPTVGEITAPIDPVEVNTEISVSADFTDPNTSDVHSGVWEWGDGTSSEAEISEQNGSGTASGRHTCTAAGVYTVTLTVTDDDGGEGWSVYQFVVVYDPAAGYATGGGWIESPEGAYAADPSLSGRAQFGFVSRYKKGATVPSGNTQFHFQVADLKFNSTEYHWMVVAGPKVMYKGSGEINGKGDYGFMLFAIDGERPGGGDVDKFRIKIWDKATEDVVYDNQMGAGDDEDPVTEIGGGNIAIHDTPGGGAQSYRHRVGIPDVFALQQNSPNPFTGRTSIRFMLPERAHTTLTVYDLSGRAVATLVDGELDAGVHSVDWDANVASGTYFCRLQACPEGNRRAGNNSASRRMTVVR